VLVDSQYNSLSDSRMSIFGVAMMMVFICHLSVHGFENISICKTFLDSFECGVDIFLFISGFGCFYSLQKHTVKDFYSNRLKRVVIPFLLFYIPFMLIVQGEAFRPLSYIFKYFWYFFEILFLYAVTPIFKKFSPGILFVVLCYIICFVLCLLLQQDVILQNIPVWFGRFPVYIGRIPIYVFGYYFASSKKEYRFNWLVAMFLLIVGLLFNFFVPASDIKYIFYSIFTLGFVGIWVNMVTKNIKYIAEFGKISFEFYIVHQGIIYIIYAFNISHHHNQCTFLLFVISLIVNSSLKF